MKTNKPTTLKDLTKWNRSGISFRAKQSPEPPPKPAPLPRVWLINPELQSVTLIDDPDYHSLITSEVGADAEDYPLNNHTALWASNTDTNDKVSYYFERMCDPLSQRRYSKGLIVSMHEPYWDEGDISYYLRFMRKEDPYRAMGINFVDAPSASE